MYQRLSDGTLVNFFGVPTGIPRPQPLGHFVSRDATPVAKSRKPSRSPAPGELARDIAGAVRDAMAPYVEEYAAEQRRAQKAEGKAMRKAMRRFAKELAADSAVRKGADLADLVARSRTPIEADSLVRFARARQDQRRARSAFDKETGRIEEAVAALSVLNARTRGFGIGKPQ